MSDFNMLGSGSILLFWKYEIRSAYIQISITKVQVARPTIGRTVHLAGALGITKPALQTYEVAGLLSKAY